MQGNLAYITLFISFLLLNPSMIETQEIILEVNPDHTYQTIIGFGASDAWRTQYIGENWPKEKKKAIAERLFSKEMDEEGNPRGIGLSMWRFYIGAGTKEQGNESNIPNSWRRAESFRDANGHYDWTKQKGQRWFLDQANKYGVDNIVAFSIAPPVYWAKNQKGFPESSGNHMNIRDDKWEDYAEFLVEIIHHFKVKGIAIDYLSPVNEPQWDWIKGSQEGTPATNEEILDFALLIGSKLHDKELDTKIILPESADLRFLYSDLNNPSAGSQLQFFSEHAYKSDLKNQIVPAVAAHSYFTTTPVDTLVSVRKRLQQSLIKHNSEYWQSEFCILEKSPDIGGGNGRDLGINTALYVARVIHADLCLANAVTWQWWTALTIADYKDGLIYLDTGIKSNLFDKELLKTNGEFHDSKLLWALGNFARFVRPGMIRIDVSKSDDQHLSNQYNNVMVSGYTDQNQDQIVLVAINYSEKERLLNLKGLDNYKITNMYVTSSNKNLQNTAFVDLPLILEDRSVTTIILIK